MFFILTLAFDHFLQFGDEHYETNQTAMAEIKGQDIHSILPTRQLSEDYTVQQVCVITVQMRVIRRLSAYTPVPH